MFEAIYKTINPKGGNGLTESIIAVAIVFSVLYCMIKGIEVPILITTAFGTVLGWMFKGNKESGEKDVEGK